MFKSMTLPHYLKNLKYQEQCIPSTLHLSPCHGYYNRQTMNNLKLRTEYGRIHYTVFFENSCSRSNPSEVLQCIFIELTRQHGCSPINLRRNFGTRFYKNISRGLLLLFLNFKYKKRDDFKL